MKKKNLSPELFELIKVLQDIFDMNSWDRIIIIKGVDERNLAADIRVEEDYQRFYLSIYPCFFESTKQDQRNYIVHEFCHAITAPLVDLLDDFKAGVLVTPTQIKYQMERATARIEHMLAGFLNDQYPKTKKIYRDCCKIPTKKRKK